MYLKSLELSGFKSFGKKSSLAFSTPITAIVGPNGSGKSNTAEAFRFVLGEQSIKSLRGKRGEDLIWNGSTTLPRAGRASVSLTFDNSKRLLDIDFDQVTVERVVNRDGTNEYVLNGSAVRLKDVVELLAGANIGSSGHHIISQGEADRVLSATPKERRSMIEDALGLRIYQYKKEESVRKLEKTEENKIQVDALRKENTPHLKFLERQMSKIARARDLRTDLVQVYREYLKREEMYLQFEKERLAGESDGPEQELRHVEEELEKARRALDASSTKDKQSEQLLKHEHELAETRRKASEISRELGRVEGQIAFEERRIEEEKRKVHEEEGRPVPFRDVRDAASHIAQKVEEGAGSDSLEHVKNLLHDTRDIAENLTTQYATTAVHEEIDSQVLTRLHEENTKLEATLAELTEQQNAIEASVRALKETVDRERDANRDLERSMFEQMAKQNDIRLTLSRIEEKKHMLARAHDEFKRELAEAVVLISRAVVTYSEEHIEQDVAEEERSVQEDRRRNLEKMKIRLEELGGAGAEEIEKEYTEVKERDSFLERELVDLAKSADSLRTLVAELEHELDEKFRQGLEHISTQFNEFFTTMFGGGSALLTVVSAQKKRKLVDAIFGGSKGISDEEEDIGGEEEGGQEEVGVDVSISLPNKRVKGLVMLSGGERALTSIALIFAMSQISAPPFIILDETDAALDEANSRRYGDMIEILSKKSQLILITHNRETMSRAGVLYGVTMGADGVSKLLSVKFDEAAGVAK